MSEFVRRGLSTTRITRTERDLVPGHRKASGKSPSLLTRTAENADRKAGNIGKIAGVCWLRTWS